MAAAVAAGLLLAAAGGACVYLASPHQRLAARAWPARPARAAGALLWATALVALLQALLPLTAVLVLATWAMLVFTLLPYLGAGRTLRGGGR
ncbi:hypothetical protein CLD22_22115 [Rubrivivax gelatinosus]|nr:hypothetical protein [Rubrivivax gelatinosus]